MNEEALGDLRAMTLRELRDRRLKVAATVDSWDEAERELAAIRLREIGITVGRARRSLASRLFKRQLQEQERGGPAERCRAVHSTAIKRGISSNGGTAIF